MKRLALLVATAAMAFGLLSASDAAFDPAWVINIKVSTSPDGSANSFISQFLTKPGSVSGIGPEDRFAPGTASSVYAYSTNGGGNLVRDGRPSFIGYRCVWIIGLGCKSFLSGTEPQTLYLFAWNPPDNAFVKTNAFVSLAGENITLYASDGTSAGQMLWRCPGVGTGTADDPNTWKSGPVAMDSQFLLNGGGGMDDPPTPEPPSLLAVLCGLGCLVNLARRKRP